MNVLKILIRCLKYDLLEEKKKIANLKHRFTDLKSSDTKDGLEKLRVSFSGYSKMKWVQTLKQEVGKKLAPRE